MPGTITDHAYDPKDGPGPGGVPWPCKHCGKARSEHTLALN